MSLCKQLDIGTPAAYLEIQEKKHLEHIDKLTEDRPTLGPARRL